MSALDSIHAYDLDLLGLLSEMLIDIAAGRLVTREPLIPLTVALMSRYCERDFNSAGEVDAAVEATVDRLLAIADNLYGVRALMEPAAAVILGAPLPPPLTYADAYRRAPDPAVCLLQ
jgi:hypothetical protein